MTPLARRVVPLLLTSTLLAGCALPGQEEAPPTAALVAAEVEPTGIVHEYDLYLAADTELEVGGSHPTTLRFTEDPDSIGGSIPGPEIRVKQGDTVRVRLHDGHHTIHWHGVRLPWAMDGVPDQTQRLGDGTYTYEFVAKDAGTFWYHCHVEAPLHVDLGMFGALIVEPADPRADPPFDREATLFLHEMDTRSWVLYDTIDGKDPRTLENRPTSPWDAPAWAHENGAGATEYAIFNVGGPASELTRGYHPRYDLFMINGKTYPDVEPVPITEGETVRIRLVNAGQLVHSMHLHGHRFLVTHKDGALLPAPYLADTIGLFPGERYDLYVTGDNPGHWDFHDHGGGWGVGAYAANDGIFPGGMMTMLAYEDWEMPSELPGPVEGALRSEAPPARGSGETRDAHAHHAARASVVKLPLALGLVP